MNTHLPILSILSILAILITVEAAAQSPQIPPDAYDNPEKLKRIAAIFSKHGFIDVGHELLHLAEQATRKAELNIFHSLLLGDIDGAVDSAKLSGRPFADRPAKVKPHDSNDNTWKIQYGGSPEAVVDARMMFELHAQLVRAIGPSPYAGSLDKNTKAYAGE
jgi:hypothetical protein